MRYIGDVHASNLLPPPVAGQRQKSTLQRYVEIIQTCPASIQVGDFGYGFCSIRQFPPEHRFIRGNHDALAVCVKSPNWIPDGHYEADKGTMFIGGAWSTDQDQRIENFDWWHDEEVDQFYFKYLIEKYMDVKPEIMVTHDCPSLIALDLLRFKLEAKGKIYSNKKYISRTRHNLAEMWSKHQPKLWIFGHHHFSYDKIVNGTRFICLDELEYIDL